ncbi:RDD family protein, partial [Microbacterium terrae]|uniref:RDD family protein n=1 Tax=Microbacterium terrae TaxID=69369 RepID=UPI001B805BE7
MTAPLPSGVQPAAISRRVGAYAIDLAIAGAIAVVLLVITSIAFGGAAADPTAGVAAAAAGALLSVLLFGLVMIVWWWGVYTWMQAGRGSIGQRLLGLRLADAETGAPIGFGRALLRNLVWGLAGSIVIGYFTPLLDASSRHQGWHDSATRSMVVDVRGAAATTAGQAFAPAAQLSSDFGAPVQRTAPVEMSWPSDFPIPAQEFGVARRGAAAPQPPAPSQPTSATTTPARVVPAQAASPGGSASTRARAR